MAEIDLIERTLGALHEAVLDDALWPAASLLVDRVTGSRGSVLVVGDGTPGDIDISLARVCFGGQRHPECEREYFGSYHEHDERLPRVRQLPDSEVVPVNSLYADGQLKTSMVYHELLVPAELGDALHARLDGPDGSRIVWTSADPVGGQGWSPSQVEALERLLPHLRQYVRVRHSLISSRAIGSSMNELLRNVHLAVIQVDARARVVAANDRARAILREGDGFLSRGRGLKALLPEEDAALQRVLARATASSGEAAQGGSILLTRQHAATKLVVHVSPVTASMDEERSGRVRALVVVVDPQSRLSLDPTRIAEILGLTDSQGEVAARLAEGLTIPQIAEATGKHVTTIKWHLSGAFAKLGVSRQPDLVRVVVSLANVPGVRR